MGKNNPRKRTRLTWKKTKQKNKLKDWLQSWLDSAEEKVGEVEHMSEEIPSMVPQRDCGLPQRNKRQGV